MKLLLNIYFFYFSLRLSCYVKCSLCLNFSFHQYPPAASQFPLIILTGFPGLLLFSAYVCVLFKTFQINKHFRLARNVQNQQGVVTKFLSTNKEFKTAFCQS